MKSKNRWLFALPIVSALTLVACTAKPPAAPKIDHAQVEKVDANLSKVVLSADAAKRLDIHTLPVRDEQVARTRIIGGEIATVPASSVKEAAPIVASSVAADQFPIAFTEAFERNSGGWPNDPSSTAWVDKDGLGYRLTTTEPGRHVAVGVPGQTNLADVYISAAFRKSAGPAGGGYGLIVRDQAPGKRDGLDQNGSYYVFEANDRGEFGVWQRDGSRWVELVAWTASSAVKPGGAENQLAVAAIGDSMSFVINGTTVTTLTDSKLKQGGVGIFVGGDGDHFQVNNLVVRAPKPAPAPAVAPADATRLVLRMTLTASDQNQVIRGQPVKILPLIPNPSAPGISVQPVEVSGDTSGLFFTLDAKAAFKAGQRVRVEVPLIGGGTQRKVVPYSSVIYDLKGQAWTYISPAPLTFVRDRVNIDFIDGDKAVLSQGPAAGTAVVSTGAAELFGTEAGVGH